MQGLSQPFDALDQATGALLDATVLGKPAVLRDGEVEDRAVDRDSPLLLSDLFAIAGRAFLAYLQPANAPLMAETELCHLGIIETKVRYLEPAFMAEVNQAAVTVHVKSAKNLLSNNFLTSPYLRVKLGNSVGTTATKSQRNARNPNWNETLALFARRADAGGATALTVEAWDADLGGGARNDDLLGTGSLLLPDLGKAGEASDTVELKLDGRVVGTVDIAYKVTPIPQDASGVDVQTPAGAPPVDPQHPDDKVRKPAPNFDGDLYVDPDNDGKVTAAFVAIAEAVKRGRLGWDNMRASAFVDCPRTGTEVWLHSNRADKTIVLAFRGTQLTTLVDALTDIKIRQVSLDSVPGQSRERTEAMMAVETAAAPSLMERIFGPGEDEPKVHRGFNAAALSVLPTLQRLVDACTGGDASWTVYTTGHSLGAAVGTLTAYRLRTRQDGPTYQVIDFGFASPRCGNEAFARAAEDEVPQAWRVFRDDDIVPEVPRSQDYTHVPHAVELAADERGLRLRDYLTMRAGDFPVSGQGVDAIRRVLRPPRAPGFAATIRNTWRIARLLVQQGGFVSGHRSTSYLATLAQLMDDASDAPEVRAALAAVAEALSEDGDEGEGEPAMS